MKWFKHDSNAMNDPRVRLLRVKYGMEGYGVYFGLLEMIASEVTENSPSEKWGKLSEIYDIDFLSAEFRIEKKKLTSIISYMSEIGLIDEFCWSQSEIANFKILVRADEYTQKLLKKIPENRLKMGSESGVNPDNVGTLSGVNRELVGTKKIAKIKDNISGNKSQCKIISGVNRELVGSESGVSRENVGLEEEVEIEIEVESEKDKKSDTPQTSPPKKFTCPSQEISDWINNHSGFYDITTQCIEVLLEEFTVQQIINRLKACNSWIVNKGKKIDNINITLNTFMDDCRKSKDKPQNPPDPPKPSYLRPFEVNEAESKAWDEKWQRENLQRRQA